MNGFTIQASQDGRHAAVGSTIVGNAKLYNLVIVHGDGNGTILVPAVEGVAGYRRVVLAVFVLPYDDSYITFRTACLGTVAQVQFMEAHGAD